MMGTNITKIKRFPIKKCSDFMAGYTKRKKPKMKTKQNVSRIFFSACQNRIIKKRKAASVIGMRPFPIISVQSMV